MSPYQMLTAVQKPTSCNSIYMKINYLTYVPSLHDASFQWLSECFCHTVQWIAITHPMRVILAVYAKLKMVFSFLFLPSLLPILKENNYKQHVKLFKNNSIQKPDQIFLCQLMSRSPISADDDH